MANNRYIFKKQQAAANLGNILYLAVSLHENDWPSNPHAHSFTEVFYVVNGEGHVLLDGTQMEVSQGDLVVVDPNVLHTERAKPGHPFEYVVVGIDGVQLVGTAAGQGYYFEHMQNQHKSLLTILNLLIEELEEQCTGHEAISWHLLTALLLRFFRAASMEYSAAPATKIPHECRRVKDYIDSYFQEPITLDSLARLAGWDKYYLSHTFSEAYGISPIKYLKEVRMNRCKQLLVDTDHTLAQIAEQMGFTSQNYFSQMFRAHTGITAREYRKQQRALMQEAQMMEKPAAV